MRSSVAKLASIALFSISTHAHAVTFNFALTGEITANWQIDSNPIPVSSGTNFFSVNNIPGTYGGLTGIRNITFFSSGGGGGLFFVVDPVTNFVANLFGPQVFSGPTTNPTFSLGTFALTSISTGLFSLSISEAAAAVPEPATWVSMMIGFGFVGGAVRYRRRSARVRLAFR